MSTESPSTALVVVQELEEAKELAVLAPESRLTLKQVFTPFFIELKSLAETASTVAVNKPKLARETRLAIRKVRIAAEKARVDAGAAALLYKKSVDGVYGLLEGKASPLEKRLADIENAEELAQKALAEALKIKRLAELAPFGQDNTFYDLANLPEMQYQQLLGSQQVAHEAKQAALKKEADDRAAAEQARLQREIDLAKENARLAFEAKAKQKALDDAKRATDEIAKKAEADRKAAEVEKAKLKADADAKLAAQAKAAADEAARVKKVADDKLAKERADQAAKDKAEQAKRDAAEKVAEAERTKVKAVADAKARQEREAFEEAATKAKIERDRLALEAEKAKRAAQLLVDAADAKMKKAIEEARILAEADQLRRTALEVKAKEDRAAKAKAASASEAEKVLVFAQEIEAVQVPTLSVNQDLAKKLADQAGKMVKWIRSEAAKL